MKIHLQWEGSRNCSSLNGNGNFKFKVKSGERKLFASFLLPAPSSSGSGSVYRPPVHRMLASLASCAPWMHKRETGKLVTDHWPFGAILWSVEFILK